MLRQSISFDAIESGISGRLQFSKYRVLYFLRNTIREQSDGALLSVGCRQENVSISSVAATIRLEFGA
jgi:hypothetical protein